MPCPLFSPRVPGQSLRMNFKSLYAHGFARVAACTTRTHLADPARNAQAVLAMARDCAAEGAALAVFPELTLSGYSIEDLLLQDALLDAVEEAIGTLVGAIQTGMADGSIRADIGDPMLLAMTLWAFTHGIIQIAMAKGTDLARHGIAIPQFSEYAFDQIRRICQSSAVE